jgi:hypothetical protein
VLISGLALPVIQLTLTWILPSKLEVKVLFYSISKMNRMNLNQMTMILTMAAYQIFVIKLNRG